MRVKLKTETRLTLLFFSFKTFRNFRRHQVIRTQPPPKKYANLSPKKNFKSNKAPFFKLTRS